MDPTWRHPYGLRPTLRQAMIVVVFVALAATLFRDVTPDVRTLLVPVSPPLLALLVVLFERTSPAKFWLAGLLASLFPPALAAWCDLLAWRHGRGQVTLVPVLVVVNALGLAWIRRAARRLPGSCPACGLRSLLPLGRQSRGMRWCASCGFAERAAPRRAEGAAGGRGPVPADDRWNEEEMG